MHRIKLFAVPATCPELIEGVGVLIFYRKAAAPLEG